MGTSKLSGIHSKNDDDDDEDETPKLAVKRVSDADVELIFSDGKVWGYKFSI